jgi:trans-aconitate methyltransferase
MNKKLETQKTYNNGAKILAEKFNKIGSRIKNIRKAFSYFKNKKDLNILEIGCGNGRDAKDILKYSKNYTGIDFSKEMIKLSKEYLPNTNFIIADIEKFTIPQNLDLIFAFASLLHLNKDSFKKVLNKIYKKLNRNGAIYISMKYSKRYKEVIKKDDFGKRYFYYYSEKNLEKISKEIGYELLYINKYILREVEWIDLILKK